jgi:hypothetical protein
VNPIVSKDDESTPRGNNKKKHAIAISCLPHAQPAECFIRSFLDIAPEKPRYRNTDLAGSLPLGFLDGLLDPVTVDQF